MQTDDNTTPPVINYEGSDYQTSFWDQGGRAYEDAAEAIALRRLLPSGGRLMLELGAGAGRNSPRYVNFERVVLLDYSHTQLEQAQQRLGRGGRYLYVAANVYRLPFTGGLFDAATMIRTLHHLSEPRLALNQVRRVLEPGAAFILEYANKQNLKAILRYALGRQKWSPFSPEPVEFTELNFDFHPATVRAWLRMSGFALERQLTVSHFRIGAFKRFVPTRLLAGMDSLAQLSGDWWQLSPSVFTRSQATGDTPRASQGAFFACPACGADLPLAEDNLTCPQCGKVWAYTDGIYDFRE
ncbi:MAG TPA: methyltransferase domain-containing protein [Anaerolineaceae bacterium]|nr:methyltransferase domain-containing protein [Anaerolineaceae bacterium]